MNRTQPLNLEDIHITREEFGDYIVIEDGDRIHECFIDRVGIVVPKRTTRATVTKNFFNGGGCWYEQT